MSLLSRIRKKIIPKFKAKRGEVGAPVLKFSEKAAKTGGFVSSSDPQVPSRGGGGGGGGSIISPTSPSGSTTTTIQKDLGMQSAQAQAQVQSQAAQQQAIFSAAAQQRQSRFVPSGVPDISGSVRQRIDLAKQSFTPRQRRVKIKVVKERGGKDFFTKKVKEKVKDTKENLLRVTTPDLPVVSPPDFTGKVKEKMISAKGNLLYSETPSNLFKKIWEGPFGGMAIGGVIYTEEQLKKYSPLAIDIARTFQPENILLFTQPVRTDPISLGIAKESKKLPITKTPLGKTFAEDIYVGTKADKLLTKFQPEKVPKIRELAIKRITPKELPKIKFDVSPEFKWKLSQQEARLKSRADIFVLDKSGNFKIVKSQPRFKAKTKPIDFKIKLDKDFYSMDRLSKPTKVKPLFPDEIKLPSITRKDFIKDAIYKPKVQSFKKQTPIDFKIKLDKSYWKEKGVLPKDTQAVKTRGSQQLILEKPKQIVKQEVKQIRIEIVDQKQIQNILLKQKQVQRQKFVTPPKQVQVFKQEQVQSQKQKQSQEQKEQQQIKTLTKQVYPPVQLSGYKQTQDFKQPQPQIFKQPLAQDFKQPQPQIFKQPQLIKQIPTPRISKAPILKEPTTKKGLRLPNFPTTQKLTPSLKSIPVYGRRFGEFRVIGKAATKEKAISFGTAWASKTLGATFKVRGVKARKIKGFKTKKTKEGVLYIEQPKYRLSKKQEVGEINLYKGLKIKKKRGKKKK